MKKFLFIDLETTGLDNQKHGIHQIAGAVHIDGEVKETFNFKVRPKLGKFISPSALEICGVTVKQIRKYKPMKVVYEKLITIMSKYVNRYNTKDKFFFVAYYGNFDNQFLREWFIDNKDNYFGSWFYPGTLDIMVYANGYMSGVRNKVVNLKLLNVAKLLDVKLENAYDADADIQATVEVAEIVAPEVFLNNKKPKLNYDAQLAKEPYVEKVEEPDFKYRKLKK